jgi:hypothetical protein
MIHADSTLSLPPPEVPYIPGVVEVGGVEHGCEIISQTKQSIQLRGVKLLVLARNKPMNILYQGGEVAAHSRNVQRHLDGSFLIDADVADSLPIDESEATMLVNCYIRLKSGVIICMPIAFEDDLTARVQLWDGMQFRVPNRSLTAMTRQERIQSLGQLDQLKTACDTYGFDSVDHELAVQRVTEFEFGR